MRKSVSCPGHSIHKSDAMCRLYRSERGIYLVGLESRWILATYEGANQTDSRYADSKVPH